MTKIDITKHSLVPKHSIVSEKEKKALLEKYNITAKELPRITKTDSAILSLKPKIGDVVKVVRKSATAGESVFYRVVTNV